MLSQCSLLAVVVLGSAHSTSDQYLQTVQDKWSKYRALVSEGGFLYNDSFIVVNDYDQAPDVTNNDNDSDNNLGDLPKLGFENTLMGMVNALQDIQSKGDQMMEAITDQKQVLVRLRSEVARAEERLEEAALVTATMEIKRSEAETEIETAERNTRMLSQRKDQIKSELESLQQEKETSMIKLESLKEELVEVNKEMEDLSSLRSSLTPLEKNVQSRQIELNNLKKSLESKTSELTQVKQQIATSTRILDNIKTNIASTPDSATDKLSEQTPSPYLVPALVVSLLLNLLTGGAIFTNYIAPTERSDSDPYQFVGESIYDEIMKNAGRSEPLFQDNDKMDRNEQTLTYIEDQMQKKDTKSYTDHFVEEPEVYYDLPRYLNF